MNFLILAGTASSLLPSSSSPYPSSPSSPSSSVASQASSAPSTGLPSSSSSISHSTSSSSPPPDPLRKISTRIIMTLTRKMIQKNPKNPTMTLNIDSGISENENPLNPASCFASAAYSTNSAFSIVLSSSFKALISVISSICYLLNCLVCSASNSSSALFLASASEDLYYSKDSSTSS